MKPHGYKALIFAAGRGQRLRPLTDTVPKPLLRVGQKFLIEYQLEALINAGFHDIVINVAWLGEAIQTALGDGTRYGCSIRYSVEAEALETVGGIVQALPLLGAKPFATVSADVYTDYSYNKLAAMCEQIETSSTAQVAHFVLAYAGIAVWHPRIFAQCVRGEKMKLFPWADQFVSAGEVSAEHHCGVWDNIGTIDELNALDARLKSQ
jgi:N-acetyl-alpha-D-muramate 1-phosphate uridylyltransferase